MPNLNSTRSTRRTPALLFLGATLLTGCGLGTASISSSGGDSSSNAAPTASALTVMRSITSPATISFVLSDQEGDPADVNISFDVGGGFLPITLAAGSGPLTGIPSNGASPIEVLWDFATDLGDESFRGDIAIQLNVVGGLSPAVLTGVSQGNDPPQVSEAGSGLAPPESQVEFSGNIDVDFLIRDSGSDRVRIMVEYRSFEDEVASSYRLARSAAVPGSQVTPTYAFVDFLTEPEDTLIEFRWDSAYEGTPPLEVNDDAQLAGKEFDVQFRFTVEDLDASSAPTGMTSVAETERFRVDNNEPPFAVLKNAKFALSVKDRGNIPISFEVFDDESDDVDVVIQWRALGEEFPVLPSSTTDLRDLLKNPARARDRREAHIAKEAPPAFTGRVGFLPGLADDQVRLPELASSAAGLLAHGIAGRTLEILRPTKIPEPVAWEHNPLNGPVASLVIGDGSSALMLDSSPNGWWVREIDLETGVVLGTLASGDGAPRALAVDPLREHLFVASSMAVFRCGLVNGEALGSVGHSLPSGPRDIAAMGSDVVIATEGDSLLRFDLADGSKVRLLSGLSEPWGIVRDPLREGSIYVAERGSNRIVSIDLDEQVPRRVPAAIAPEDAARLGEFPVPSPRSLALENGGARLLVLCDEGSTISLRSLDLNRSSSSGRGPAFVREISDQLTEPDAWLATGADNLRIVGSSSASQLTVGGGVSLRRKVVSTLGQDQRLPYDPSTQAVRIEAAFNPSPGPGSRWRVRVPATSSSSPEGRSKVFLWDSSEVPDASQVTVQVLPFDSDVSTTPSVSQTISYRSDFAVERVTVDSVGVKESIAVADLDDDGDLDLVTASGRLAISFQESPGKFRPAEFLPPVVSGFPTFVAAADLDGDGDVDLMQCSSDPNSLGIVLRYQTSPGQFSIGPFFNAFGTPESLAPGDLDGDGDMDFAAAVSSTDSLVVYYQVSPGDFEYERFPLPPDSDPWSVAVADLDGDGDLDLVTTCLGSDSLALLFQVSPGKFELKVDHLPTGALPVQVLATDLDQDGDQDLVSANEGSSDLTLFFQFTPGEFSPADEPLDTLSLSSRISVAAADLDLDGDTDLISAANTDRLALFFQTTPGVFVSASAPVLTSDSTSLIAAADLDGDADVDIVLGNAAVALPISILLQASPGQFEPGVDQFQPEGSFPLALSAADLDQDGDLDLTWVKLGAVPKVAFQIAPGVFGPIAMPLFPSLSLDTAARSVATGDLDNDGDQDLVSTHATGVRLHYQSSPGEFDSSAELLPTASIPGSASPADLDCDGDMDLIVTFWQTGSFELWYQVAPGVFDTEVRIFTGGEQPPSIIAADLDMDGDLDLVSTDTGNDNLILLYQSSPGVFVASAPMPTGSGPRSTTAADLDQDGDTDLVTANGGSNDLSLFYQTSPGVFEVSPTRLVTGDQPSATIAADLDGDGSTDLIANGTGDLIFYQRSLGEFTAEPAPPLADFGVAADLDGDGDLDLVSIDPTGTADLTIHFNGN